METLNTAARLLAKRPSILVLTIILSTLLCIVENLFITMLYGITMFKSGSPFDDYVNIIQFVIDAILVPETAVKLILALVVLIVVGALILAVLLSGYLYILNNAVDGKSKKVGSEFILGVRKYFLRMVTINLWTISAMILFIIYVLIATIPAAIVMDNALNGSLSIFAGTILAIITILVIFFSYAFIRQYIAYWYPSALLYDKGHFGIAKKISDNNFWSLLSKLIVFDIVLVVFNLLYAIANFSLADSQVISSATNNILLLINIIFKTIYIALLVCFIFTSFKKCNDKYQHLKQANS